MSDGNAFKQKDWLRLAAGLAWLVIFVFQPQLTFAVTLLIIGVFFISFNAMVFWIDIVCGRHAPAVAPIVGGIIASAGIVIMPLDNAWHWFWVPLLLDWGGIPLFLYGAFRFLMSKVNRK